MIAPAPSPHPLLPAEVQARYRRDGHWRDLTLAEFVAAWALQDPSRPAIVGETQLSYSELWERARRLAGALAEAGLKPGEFLVVVQSNCWQGVLLSVAASVAGIALSPLSARISPTLAVNLFEQVGGRGLVIEGALLDQPEWLDAFNQLRARITNGPVMIQGEAPKAAHLENLTKLEDASLNSEPIDQRARDAGRVCLVMATGGSTGAPKSVMHCENTLVYAARAFAAASDFGATDVHIAFGPYGHATGSLFEVYMPLLHGARVLPCGRWRAETVVDEIARWGGTYCITVGTHIFDLLSLDPSADAKLASMRLIVSGAGPDQLFIDAETRFGTRIVRDYGLSECLGHAMGRPDDPSALRLHKDGVPFPGIEFRVIDQQTGDAVVSGKAGEYFVRGPSMFMGYLGAPDLTADTLTPDAFYRTGDLMTETADGYITWAGRLKDVIRRGGLQVDVIELESMLVEHPAIAGAAVVGEPHPRLGEEVVIVAAAQPGQPRPTLNELIAHLSAQGLPKECMPRKLAYIDALPVTEWGKYNRAEIRKWLAEQPQSGG